MIHRQNWLDVQDFLEYQEKNRQRHDLTITATWTRLRMLLEWADDKPFGKAARIKPTFPVYVEGLRTGKGKPFSGAYLTGIFGAARFFFEWAKREWPTRYKSIDGSWIDTINSSRMRSEEAELHTREIYTLEDVRALMAVPAETLYDRRIRAGVAFLFLSGMRIGAFLTLPLSCIDLERMSVLQLPERGVQTKRSRAARTYLLHIPDLLDVVREWDAEIRPLLPESGYWFARIDHRNMLVTDPPETGGRNFNLVIFNQPLKELCEKAGIPYRSPHKLRHGFAVYALKRAKTMAELKAISQNLMHKNIGITDGIYGRLVDDDVKNIITGL